MDDLLFLQNLSSFTELEHCEDSFHPSHTTISHQPIFTASAILPNGKKISLLKSVLSSCCENNCFYCPYRAGRDFQRYSFSPEGFAKLFMNLFHAGIVEGLFISSGVIHSGIHTQDKLITVAEILRHRYHFQGYIHLKLMPSCEKAQVEKTMALANRVSINLEAPNEARLRNLAPDKLFSENLLLPLQWIQEIRENTLIHNFFNDSWVSSTTQFVVGASQETDLELLSTTEVLFHQYKINRAYFSPFHPYPDTPLENHPPASLLRQQRLNQASFLIRDYGFSLKEIILDRDGNLPLSKDPKAIWAERHFAHAPLEINSASPQTLIRIPGIGKRGLKAILWARKQHTINDLSLLKKLGIATQRAAPYILLNGKRPLYQLKMWDEAEE